MSMMGMLMPGLLRGFSSNLADASRGFLRRRRLRVLLNDLVIGREGEPRLAFPCEPLGDGEDPRGRLLGSLVELRTIHRSLAATR